MNSMYRNPLYGVRYFVGKGELMVSSVIYSLTMSFLSMLHA